MRNFFDEDYFEYMDLLYDDEIKLEEEDEDEEACYFDVPLPFRPVTQINYQPSK